MGIYKANGQIKDKWELTDELGLACDYLWPHASCFGMSGVRYFSENNPWIDFVVVFDDSQYTADTVARLVDEAMDAFWDDEEFESECYGDVIPYYLKEHANNDIRHFMILFHDSDDESDDYDEMWGKWVKQFNIVKTLSPLGVY